MASVGLGLHACSSGSEPEEDEVPSTVVRPVRDGLPQVNSPNGHEIAFKSCLDTANYKYKYAIQSSWHRKMG